VPTCSWPDVREQWLASRCRRSEGLSLEIDSNTLADLEVFEDATGRGGLFAIVDRTETQVGRRTLRRWLSSPPHDTPTIRRIQQSVRFLAESSSVERLVSPGTTEVVQRYLESNIQIGRGHAVGWLRLTVRYRDVLRELRAGVFDTGVWLREVLAGARSLLALNPPELLRSLGDELTDLCLVLPSAAHARVWKTERLDRTYRLGEKAAIDRLIEIVGELDALRSMAATTRSLGWTFPEIVQSEQFGLEGEGVFHPFLESPVANPVTVTGGEPMVFLTGPNMAGKTTYLRTAAMVCCWPSAEWVCLQDACASPQSRFCSRVSTQPTTSVLDSASFSPR
jgi:DNA mismatch repair protein MutS